MLAMLSDQEFRELLHHLGFLWKGYRRVRKGVKKRVRRHMKRLGCQDVASYLQKLDDQEEARQECDRLMTVPVSRFFRDRMVWELLEQEILPQLLKKYSAGIRVWSAGCASGEEVYSLKIVWERLAGSPDPNGGLEITATDINPSNLQRARAGVYLASSLKEVPEQVKALYFVSQGDSELHAVRSFLKRGIIWKKHNLLSDPSPGSCFHMIFLRNNLLTYYQDQLKEEALGRLLRCLCKNGFLIVGSNEKLPFARNDLFLFGALPYVYQKRGPERA